MDNIATNFRNITYHLCTREYAQNSSIAAPAQNARPAPHKTTAFKSALSRIASSASPRPRHTAVPLPVGVNSSENKICCSSLWSRRAKCCHLQAVDRWTIQCNKRDARFKLDVCPAWWTQAIRATRKAKIKSFEIFTCLWVPSFLLRELRQQACVCVWQFKAYKSGHNYRNKKSIMSIQFWSKWSAWPRRTLSSEDINRRVLIWYIF